MGLPLLKDVVQSMEEAIIAREAAFWVFFLKAQILKRYSGRKHWTYHLCHHREETGRVVL
nr:unnamed protein product [Digitaria exilis]